MAEAKHSHGPWWATDYGIRNAGGYICALAHPTKYEGQDERYAAEKAEREGDARLIAAAHALYEALQSITDQLERVGDYRKDRPFIDAARAALALARGEA